MTIQLTLALMVMMMGRCAALKVSPTTVPEAIQAPANGPTTVPMTALKAAVRSRGGYALFRSKGSVPSSGRVTTSSWEAEAESLGQMMRTLVREALAECDLTVVGGGGAFWRYTLRHLLRLPNPRQLMHMAAIQDTQTLVHLTPRCRGVVCLADDPASILAWANVTSSSWDYDSRMVVIGLTREQLKSLMLTKSGRRTKHIVGVVKSEHQGEWWLYMHQLFVDEVMTRVTVWQDDRFVPKQDLFPDKQATLRGAVIKLVTLEFAPVLFYQRAKNGTLMYRYGRDVAIVEALSQALNFTIEFMEVPPGELWGERLENGSFNGLVGYLSRDEADIASGNVYISSHLGRLEHQSFSASYTTDQSCFNARVEPPLPQWQSLILPYKLNTWMVLLGGLLICSPFLYVLTRMSNVGGRTEIPDFPSLTYSSLYVFGMQFRVSQSWMPQQTNIQIFVAFLWLYVIIITTGYSSNLTAFLTVTRNPKGIETIEELYQSKLPVRGLGEYFKYSMLQSMNKHVRGLADNYQVSFDVDDIDKLIMDGKGVSIHGLKYLQYTIKKRYTSTLGRASMRILKECFASHSIALGLQTHSPLKSKFDRVISWVVESGLVNRWFLESINLSLQNEKMDKEILDSGDVKTKKDLQATGSEGVIPLGLDHMQGIFMIIIFSYLVSLLVFLTEKVLMKNSI